jgi:hypothetical protein
MPIPPFDRMEEERTAITGLPSGVPTFEDMEERRNAAAANPEPLSVDMKVEEKKTKRIINNADKLRIPLETADSNDNMLQGIEPGGISKYRNPLLPLVPGPGGPLAIDQAKLKAAFEEDQAKKFSQQELFERAQARVEPTGDPSDVDPGDYLMGVFRDIDQARFDE